MAFDDKGLDDYVDVSQRIADFREQYPDGSLQPLNPGQPFRLERVPSAWCVECIGRRVIKAGRERVDGRWVDKWKRCGRCEGSGLRGEGEPGDDLFIVYTAAAYRNADDTRPGIGTAWEAYPGRTPYTKASELMNAETSAWGRAIIAVLASDSKAGVASRDEVRNRRAERDDGLPANRDGSLSRSGTTDEEKAAAGVMTAAEQKEHSALAPKRGESRPAERVTAGGAPPDPWADQPPGDAAWEAAIPARPRPGRRARDVQASPARAPDGTPDSGPARAGEPGLPADSGENAAAGRTPGVPPSPGSGGSPAAGNPPTAAGPQTRASKGQVGVIRAHFKRLGYGEGAADTAERLAFTARLAGLDAITSTNDLNPAECGTVITELEKLRDRAQLRALVTEGEAVAAKDPPGGVA